MSIIKYRVFNTTKNISEYVLVDQADDVPLFSNENPSDTFDHTMTEIVNSDSEFSKEDDSLDAQKYRKDIDIDLKTQELIALGFIYDSTPFSLSANAQTNWIGMKQAADINLLAFPFSVSTRDDSEYTFVNHDELDIFYQTGLGTKMYHLTSGRNLKVLVSNATNQTELDAIVDGR